MGNRIIKESICTSDTLDQLNAFQETFFYRLIVNCDDYGRMDARPKILAAKLFPLKDLRTQQIEEALRTLTSVELVTLYTVGGKPFLQMNTWDRHQQIRACKGKYPGPECADAVEDDSSRNQPISDDIRCSLNPIQSNTNTNPNTNTNTATATAEMTARFDRFWTAYPRKEKKQGALAAFKKLKPDEALLETMLAAIERWKQSAQWQEDGGRFIPQPTSWLNGRRWEDEVRPASSGGRRDVAAQAYAQREYSSEDERPEEMLRRLQAEMEGA